MAKHICKKDHRFRHRELSYNYQKQTWDYYYLAESLHRTRRAKRTYKKLSRKLLRKYLLDTAIKSSTVKRIFDIAWRLW